MKRFFKLEFPHGFGGQQGQAPAQVVELGKHASEALLNMYREKGVTVTECEEDGSSPPDGNKAPARTGGTKTRESRAAELAAMKWPELCDLAKSLDIAAQGKKREMVEEEILAAECPKAAE